MTHDSMLVHSLPHLASVGHRVEVAVPHHHEDVLHLVARQRGVERHRVRVLAHVEGALEAVAPALHHLQG